MPKPKDTRAPQYELYFNSPPLIFPLDATRRRFAKFPLLSAQFLPFFSDLRRPPAK
jgi:hypothetical protein